MLKSALLLALGLARASCSEPPIVTAPTHAEDDGTIEARHVLVMYAGSRSAPPTITRTKAEARARAQEVLDRARAGESFGALAREFSDDAGSAQRGGLLGRFAHGSMVPAFDQAAFALEPNGISEIVETDFGYHVIQRTK